jgi:hypothetical protein
VSKQIPEDEQMVAAVLTRLHCDALNNILRGVESIIDGRVAAAIYIARAGAILATLRKYNATSEAEIQALAEVFTEQAMRDELAGNAHTADGLPVLSDGEKKRMH